MKALIRLSAVMSVVVVLSGCMTAVGAIAANEDVQDFAIEGVADFLDL